MTFNNIFFVFGAAFFACRVFWMISNHLRAGRRILKLERLNFLPVILSALAIALYVWGWSSKTHLHSVTDLFWLTYAPYIFLNSMAPYLCDHGIILSSVLIPWSRIQSAKWLNEKKDTLQLEMDDTKWSDKINYYKITNLTVSYASPLDVENLLLQKIPSLNGIAIIPQPSNQETIQSRKPFPIISSLWFSLFIVGIGIGLTLIDRYYVPPYHSVVLKYFAAGSSTPAHTPDNSRKTCDGGYASGCP